MIPALPPPFPLLLSFPAYRTSILVDSILVRRGKKSQKYRNRGRSAISGRGEGVDQTTPERLGGKDKIARKNMGVQKSQKWERGHTETFATVRKWGLLQPFYLGPHIYLIHLLYM
jgi:hypothetical protein